MGSFGHDVDPERRSKDIQIEENVNFQTLLLPDFILKGLKASGFKRPSPIQLAAIPLGRCGLDLIVQAKSGTGKTLVFALIALESLDQSVKRTQVIIVAPTREIAVQIADVIETVGQFCKGLSVGVLIGGTPMEMNRNELQKHQIVVGAPGRIRHIIESQVLDSKAVRLFVLDEADKLMEDVFMKDINYIFHNVAESKQTVACSATYSPQLVDFVKQYMRRGTHVTPSGGPCPILVGLRQFIYQTRDHVNKFTRQAKKQEALFRLISTVQFDQCLVFSNYIVRAESLCGILQNQGWAAICLTSNQTQAERLEAMAKLKEHKVRILVTTDLAARGIDASAVNFVINMDIPFSPEIYLHRIGRAGRFGNKGICVTIVSKGEDVRNFRQLIGKISSNMSVNVIPEGRAADLWNDEFKVLTGEEETKNEKTEEVAKETTRISDSLEEGEIAEDDQDTSGDLSTACVENDSSSSGIDASFGSPHSNEYRAAFPNRKWKTRYFNGSQMVSSFREDVTLNQVTDDLSSIRVDLQRHQFSAGPWLSGHEHLWKNGHPQSYFPSILVSYGNGVYNYPNKVNRFPPSHNNHTNQSYGLRSYPNSYQGTFGRQGHWMNQISSKINDYVQYSRKFN